MITLWVICCKDQLFNHDKHKYTHTHLERLSIRTPCLVSVSLESILMVNSLSTSKTKEMAPVSGFMYSKNESFTTSQLQHTQSGRRNINDFCVDVKFCSFLLTAVDHFLCFSFGGKGVGRKSSWGCRWTGWAFQTCGIIFCVVFKEIITT